MKKLFAALGLFALANYMIFSVALAKIENPMLGLISSGYHMHFIAFFCLSFTLSLVLIHEKVKLPAPFTLCFLYSAFIAVLIEILQMMTGYRSFNVLDIIMGFIGAGAYSVFG